MKAGRIDKYRKIKRVGEGAYGVVYEAEDVENG
jgi:serine/threonine protein kinase